MTTQGQTVISDWLALHGLDADDCLARLDAIRISLPHQSKNPAFPQAQVLDVVMAALLQALPDGAATLNRVRTDVQIQLAPDPVQFPRAFTLHDDGRGLPFVSCPLTGRLSDVLLLAHEIGHACQILASAAASLPPLQRETAAYLAEELVLGGHSALDAAQLHNLGALHRARTSRIMARDGAALRQGLRDPMQQYDYGWNYPIARDLAARAARQLSAAEKWRVIAGDIGLGSLLRLP